MIRHYFSAVPVPWNCPCKMFNDSPLLTRSKDDHNIIMKVPSEAIACISVASSKTVLIMHVRNGHIIYMDYQMEDLTYIVHLY